MGLIRKTFAISTVGIVNPNSKKQRVAKAHLNELKKQTAVFERAAAAAAEQQREQDLAQQRAEMQAMENRRAILTQPQPVEPPPAGWYPDADRAHLLRWWDGTNWTARTAPRV